MRTKSRGELLRKNTVELRVQSCFKSADKVKCLGAQENIFFYFSNIPLRPSGQNVQCKPMELADFQLIEAQLLGNLEMRADPTALHGWSGPSIGKCINA